jgi:hypothetical protein
MSQGLLERRPLLARSSPRSSAAVDVASQLEELATLFKRGLLSRSEFERQKRKVLED